MSETSNVDNELPQIIVYNSSDAPGVDVDQIADGPDDIAGLVPMLVGILNNLHRGGATLESMQYSSNAEDPDCVITVHSDRPDWHELATDGDLDMGQMSQAPDSSDPAQRAMSSNPSEFAHPSSSSITFSFTH
jgi:hypothetical protein